MLFDLVNPAPYVVDLPYPEGPTFDRDGRLYVCLRRSGSIVRFSAAGSKEHILSCAKPNGSKLHANGDLYVCDSIGRQVLAMNPAGVVRCVVDNFGGTPLLGPNDLIFDAGGGLFFTDPGTELTAAVGSVYRLDVTGRLDKLVDGLLFPNGIALTPGDQALLVAESSTGRILQWELNAARMPASGMKVFAELGTGIPDGIALDVAGRLYVTLHGAGRVVVLDAHGQWIGDLNSNGNWPTNLAFWNNALYVTEDESASVQCLEIGVPGLPLYHQYLKLPTQH